MKGGKRNKGKVHHGNPQLFEDTSFNESSYSYPNQGYGQQQNFYQSSYPNQSSAYPPQQPLHQPQQSLYSGQQLLNDPMANIAMHYGQSIADQGSDLINKNLEKYVSRSNLKYYFAVDNSYVMKKLGLLCFPFLHKDWCLSHSQEEPVAPRFDINARDLYIPVMAFVTYVLMAGLLLGMQHRFSPEQLGVISSSSLIWTLLELLVVMVTKYLLQISYSSHNGPTYLDWLAFCGYKYVGIIIILLMSIFFQQSGYYGALIWMSISISFFMIRSLKVSILGGMEASHIEGGKKRKLYMMLLIATIQPIMMWWLSRSLAMSTPYSLKDLNNLTFNKNLTNISQGLAGDHDKSK